MGVGEVVDPFAPLVSIPTVVAALVVSADGPRNLCAVLTNADFVALQQKNNDPLRFSPQCKPIVSKYFLSVGRLDKSKLFG